MNRRTALMSLGLVPVTTALAAGSAAAQTPVVTPVPNPPAPDMPAPVGGGVYSGPAGTTQLLMGGLVRFTHAARGPALLVDAGHTPSGIVRARTVGTDLVLDFDRRIGSVVSFWSDTDETLSPLGFTAGLSVGLHLAVLRMSYLGKRISVLDRRLYVPSANVSLGIIATL